MFGEGKKNSPSRWVVVLNEARPRFSRIVKKLLNILFNQNCQFCSSNSFKLLPALCCRPIKWFECGHLFHKAPFIREELIIGQTLIDKNYTCSSNEVAFSLASRNQPPKRNLESDANISSISCSKSVRRLAFSLI